MKTSLFRAATGSLLWGGFLHFSFAQEFIQDLGNSTVVAEQSTETILDGLCDGGRNFAIEFFGLQFFVFTQTV